jgi:WD40 repeat protein
VNVTSTDVQLSDAPAQERVESSTFDAFLSYSHAVDGQLAPALERGLELMAKPWYRRRGLRIFRDQTSLSASPELWGSIETALGSARAFILLTAPEAAASRWVEQEVAWWRAHHSSDTCFMALTGGELAWDSARGDFTTESAVPPSMRGWFASEPLWVDLRWARTDEHLSLRNPRFRDSVAELAAPLRGMPKDDLVGEDVRLHRRAMRLARGAVALLVLLTIVAAIGAVVAVIQRNTARDQSSLATARQIGATATGALASRLDVANGLAAEAYLRRATDQTEASLFGAVAASPHLVRFRSTGTRVTGLAPSTANGDEVLVGEADGRVRAWSLRDGRFGAVLVDTPAEVTAIRRSSSTGLLAVADGRGNIVVRDMSAETSRRLRVGGPVKEIAIDDAGRRLAVSHGTNGSTLSLFGLTTGGLERRIEARWDARALRFGLGGRRLLVGSGSGAYQWYTVPNLGPIGAAAYAVLPANGAAEAYSADRRYYGYHKFGMRVRDTTGADPPRVYPLDTATPASAVAISPDASRAAVAAGGTIAVLRPKAHGGRYGIGADPGGLAADVFTGLSTDVTALTFARGNRQVVSASGDVLALWDPAQRSRLARQLPVRVEDLYDLQVRPGLALSSDGRYVAVTDERSAVTIVDLHTGRTVASRRFTSAASPDLGSEILLDKHGKTATFVTGYRPPDLLVQVDLASGDVRRSLIVLDAGDTRSVKGLLAGPHGQPTIVYSDGSVALADVQYARLRRVAGPVRFSMYDPEAEVHGAAVDPGKGVLYEVVGRRLWSVDLATGKRTAWRGLRGETISAVAASADGRTVATSDGQASARVWDVSSRRVIRTLDTGPVFSLALDDDASHLVTIEQNGTMSLWRPRAGTKLGDLALADPQIGIRGRGVSTQTRAVFGRDGTLWTATTGLGLYAWRMSPSAWLRTACTTIGRSLSPDEWRRYLGTEYTPRWHC